MRRYPRGAVFGAILVTAALALPAPGQSQTAAPGLTSTTIVAGRDATWDMAFLPDGTMFFTEKCRGLSVRLPNGTITPLLGMKDSRG
jgi:glucose/arabinose dehydrogenase